MRRKDFCLLAFLVCFSCGWAYSAIVQSSIDDQASVEVSVYNSNIGLIKELRKVQLSGGDGEIRFMDVPSGIIPETVYVQSLAAGSKFTVYEQNYEYDLLNEQKLLSKYIGKTIKLVDVKKESGTKEVVEAVLLNNGCAGTGFSFPGIRNDGDAAGCQQVYKIKGEIYLGYPGYKVLPEIPEGMVLRPTLSWLYRAAQSKEETLEVSYLTNNITWKADYVGVLSKDDAFIDFSGWVTVDNNSGVGYKNARLKLIAGEINRVQPAFPMEGLAAAGAMDMAKSFRAAEPQFKQQQLFEYHMYDLQRPTTLKNQQSKQIQLLQALKVGVQKEYLVFAKNAFRYNSSDNKVPVEVHVRFKNTKQNNMGMPVPEGVVRVYKRDNDDKVQFVGEDRIKHTPQDEDIKIMLGKAFDVVAERKQTEARQVSVAIREEAFTVTVRNHKDKDVTVGIIESINQGGAVVENSHPFKKEDAFTIRFDVVVPKNGEAVVKYRVRYKHQGPVSMYPPVPQGIPAPFEEGQEILR